jgi:hypothetical protein
LSLTGNRGQGKAIIQDEVRRRRVKRVKLRSPVQRKEALPYAFKLQEESREILEEFDEKF